MKELPWLKSILLVAAGSLLVSGCETHERVVYRQTPPPPQYSPPPQYAPPPPVASQEIVVTEAPPPIIVERPTPRPGAEYVWIKGAYVWHGHWEWEHGRWERPPHHGAVWVPHRYEERGNVHVFISGYWR
jgi:hypothetical protein